MMYIMFEALFCKTCQFVEGFRRDDAGNLVNTLNGLLLGTSPKMGPLSHVPFLYHSHTSGDSYGRGNVGPTIGGPWNFP